MKKYTPSRVPKPKWATPNSLIAHGTSKEEKSVYNFLRLEFPDVPIYCSDRVVLNGRELDIYVPSRNFAVEYNGLYFHNSSSKTPNYHLTKTLMCEKKNIRLVSLFSDEWIEKKPQCVDLLRKGMGKYIEIKDFEVGVVESRESINFFNACHLLGHDQDNELTIGCFSNGKLISAMELQKVDNNWRITRFVDAFGIKAYNGIQRMIEFLEDEYDIYDIELILDRRILGRDEFLSSGFEEISATSPSFTYTKDFKSRIDPSKLSRFTESEIEGAGYTKVYDCGYVLLKRLEGCSNS